MAQLERQVAVGLELEVVTLHRVAVVAVQVELEVQLPLYPQQMAQVEQVEQEVILQ
jgi:hypothetical protein